MEPFSPAVEGQYQHNDEVPGSANPAEEERDVVVDVSAQGREMAKADESEAPTGEPVRRACPKQSKVMSRSSRRKIMKCAPKSKLT